MIFIPTNHSLGFKLICSYDVLNCSTAIMGLLFTTSETANWRQLIELY